MNRLNNPTEIAGCILWLDGADKASMRQNFNDVSANVSDGNQVGYWSDKSGNLPVTNFTNWQTTRRPTYVESVSSLRFASVFSTSLSALGNLNSLVPSTIFVVTAPHVVGNTGRIFTTAVPAVAESYIPFITDVASGVNGIRTQIPGQVCTIFNTALSSFDILTHRNTGAASGLNNYLNGNWSDNGTFSTSQAKGCFRIGGGIGNGTTGTEVAGSYYSGYIAEVIVYSSGLGQSDFTRVLNYLYSKWNFSRRVIFALKEGNWNDTGLWSTSAYPSPQNLPGIDDYVFTNGFNVSANTSSQVRSLGNGSITPYINDGGSFILPDGVSITAPTIYNFREGNSIAGNNSSQSDLLCCVASNYSEIFGNTFLTKNAPGQSRMITHLGTGTLYISSTHLGCFGNNGLTYKLGLILNNSTGTLNIVASAMSAGSSSGPHTILFNRGAGIINLRAITLISSSITNSIEAGPMISNFSTGTYNITAVDIFSTNNYNAAGGYLIQNSSSGVCNIKATKISIAANVTLNTANAIGNTGTGNCNIEVEEMYDRSFFGSSTSNTSITAKNIICNGRIPCILSTSSRSISVIGNILNAPNLQAINATRLQVFPASTPTYTRHAVNGYDKFVYYYTGDTVFVPPLSTNVLQGVTYNFGALTGTMIVPAITAVNAGVKVGTAIGSAYLSVSDFWNEPLSAIQINSNTIGEYMKKTLTVNSLSSVLNSLDFSKL